MKLILVLICSAFSILASAQSTRKVLFIGNSYTYVNDLPHLIEELAAADGNQLIHDANTPGGYQLSQHATDATTLSKIASQPWDFVVIQEQSQKPSFPDAQVQSSVYPYATILVDSVRSNDACSIPLFYDTWGHENGDSQWVGINTFEKMNNRIFHAYTTMTTDAEGMMSPVGAAYRHIKMDTNAAVDFTALYQSDESHPTIFGSYLGACIFNDVLFSTTSLNNTFIPNAINGVQANYLQTVADHVVYGVDSIHVDFRPLTQNSFTYTQNDNTVQLSPSVQQGQFDTWLFGDQMDSNLPNTSHTYSVAGTYTIGMVSSNGCYSDTVYQTIVISTAGLPKEKESKVYVFPNPSRSGLVNITTNKKYRIYSVSGDLIYRGTAHQLHLQPGMYVFLSGKIHQKIIVL